MSSNKLTLAGKVANLFPSNWYFPDKGLSIYIFFLLHAKKVSAILRTLTCQSMVKFVKDIEVVEKILHFFGTFVDKQVFKRATGESLK